MEKLPSFGKGMEKQKSFRGFMEKQKSFRIVMEKQLSFIGGDRSKKTKDSPGKRGDSQLHLAARAGNLVRLKEILHTCSAKESLDFLSKPNQERETPFNNTTENGIVLEILKKKTDKKPHEVFGNTVNSDPELIWGFIKGILVFSGHEGYLLICKSCSMNQRHKIQ